MHFSTIFVAASALLCASASAAQPADAGEVMGMPVSFDAPVSLRNAQFVKGDAIIHSRSEHLATSNVAVPNAGNPYTKVQGTGTMGVALSIEGDKEEESSSSSAWTLPLAVGGCAVAAVGIAGFVLMKKRKQETDSAEATKTPTADSPNDDIVDYKNDMETPV